MSDLTGKGTREGGSTVFAVLGAGSWGTALAMQAARSGARTVLWSVEADQVATMAQTHANEDYLPGCRFPPSLEVSGDLLATVRDSDEVLIAVPSHAFVPVLENIAPVLKDGQGVAWATKGLEPGCGELLHIAARRILQGDRPLAVLTGPSFAKEVAADLPTAVTVAGTQSEFCNRVAQAFHGGNFRAYTSDDIVGAELGGAVKNVLAVATGISDGMGLGDNARAALVTRGLAEMMRLGRALGAQPQTLMGLAGMGDLVLTCTGDLSRNRRLGLALGQGQKIDQAVKDIGQVVEGVQTSEEVWRLASRLGVDMPISEQVYGILHQGLDPYECVRNLLSREQKPEVS